MQHLPSTSACRPRPRVRATFLHEQWANRPCGLMYRIIFFFTNSCEPELAHRLRTSCGHTETVCQAFYHILRSTKTRCTQGRLFYTQGRLFCALEPLFCALVREEAIFAVCKRCANEGFACICKEKEFFDIHNGCKIVAVEGESKFFFV